MLIFIEVVLGRMVTSFNVDVRFAGNMQVIWAIGVSGREPLPIERPLLHPL